MIKKTIIITLFLLPFTIPVMSKDKHDSSNPSKSPNRLEVISSQLRQLPRVSISGKGFVLKDNKVKPSEMPSPSVTIDPYFYDPDVLRNLM